LVSKTKGKYRIPTLDVRDAREIAHLRAVLEAGTLLLMHHAMAPEDLQKIRQAAIDFDELFRKQYFNGAREADLRFHQAIVASSRNPRLIKFYEASNLPLIEAPAGPPTAESTNFAPAVQEHREILAALERGDNGEAARLLERHLEHAEARRGKLADSGDGARSQAPRP
jgi:DNA-binding GntR family transcriptional regulator